MKTKVSILFAAILAFGFAIAACVVYLSYMPVYVSLPPGSCTNTSASNPVGFMGSAKLPCRFTAYAFQANKAWVVYGASDNVKGQCLKIPPEALVAGALKPVLGEQVMGALPPACVASYAVYRPVPTARFDVRRLTALFD